MFNKNKLNFWRLAFLFSGITILILFFLWSSPKQPTAQMMDSSMGSMAKQMHLSNATIYSLINGSEMPSAMKDMSNHHPNQSKIMMKMSFFTTATIFLLIPFIIGGTIILAIVWLK